MRCVCAALACRRQARLYDALRQSSAADRLRVVRRVWRHSTSTSAGAHCSKVQMQNARHALRRAWRRVRASDAAQQRYRYVQLSVGDFLSSVAAVQPKFARRYNRCTASGCNFKIVVLDSQRVQLARYESHHNVTHHKSLRLIALHTTRPKRAVRNVARASRSPSDSAAAYFLCSFGPGIILMRFRPNPNP